LRISQYGLRKLLNAGVVEKKLSISAAIPCATSMMNQNTCTATYAWRKETTISTLNM
jgi:hypothetical protein